LLFKLLRGGGRELFENKIALMEFLSIIDIKQFDEKAAKD
jgi:hypothetical protein